MNCIQDLHLIPEFGDWFVDAIDSADIDRWLAKQGRKVQDGEISPNTGNNRLRILLSTLHSAVRDLHLQRDPTVGIEPLDTSTWQTYSEEDPNALTVDEVPGLMAKARELYSQHYAMIDLGLATGRRPCELRPLRRKGPTPDLLWTQHVILIRRSEGMGEAPDRTKTGLRLRIHAPTELTDILRRHLDQLPEGPMCDSELLFPQPGGSSARPTS